MISEVDGYFKTCSAKLTSIKDDFSGALFELTDETNSINTENEMKDNDLRSTGFFFDVEKFPSLTFKSTSFKKVSGNKYSLGGNLTMKSVTKPITREVPLKGKEPHPRTKINRKDFCIGINAPQMMVGNEVVTSSNWRVQQGL